MKTLYFAMALAAISLLLGGCGNSEDSSGTPANAAQQAAAMNAIPPQAQQAANGAADQKSQMDAMRAKDAAKSSP